MDRFVGARTATTAQESSRSRRERNVRTRNTTVVDEVVTREPPVHAPLACGRHASPSHEVDKSVSFDGAVERLKRRGRPMAEAFEETRAIGLTPVIEAEEIEAEEIDSADGDAGPTCLGRSVQVTTPGPLEAESCEEIQTAGLESSDKTPVVGGDHESSDVRENDSKPGEEAAPQEVTPQTPVETTETEWTTVGGSVEHDETTVGGEDGSDDKPLVAVGPSGPESSDSTQIIVGDRESPEERENDRSEPDAEVIPSESTGETTETELTAAEDDETTVGEHSSVAMRHADEPLVAVDQIVRVSEMCDDMFDKCIAITITKNVNLL